jgi:hypothetical protein
MNDDTTGHHPVNIGHLVMGLAFAGLVLIWAVVQADWVDGDDIRGLLPVPWILAGAAGLTASVLGGRRHHEQQVTGWVPAGPSAAPSVEPGVPGGDGEVGVVGEDRVDPGVQ